MRIQWRVLEVCGLDDWESAIKQIKILDADLNFG